MVPSERGLTFPGTYSFDDSFLQFTDKSIQNRAHRVMKPGFGFFQGIGETDGYQSGQVAWAAIKIPFT